MQERIAIYGGTQKQRITRLKTRLRQREGSKLVFSSEKQDFGKDVSVIPPTIAGVIGLKPDIIGVENADEMPQDRLDLSAMFSWAKTTIIIFPQDGGRVKEKRNEDN